MKRFNHMVYLAGPMESVSVSEMSSWRNEFSQNINLDKILVFDPCKEELIKNNITDISESIDIMNSAKMEGRWDDFFNIMWKIWFGTINKNIDIIQLLTYLRMDKHVGGVCIDEMKYWGDAEAVIKSDYVVLYAPHDKKMVGTIFEMVLAFLFNIPIYLIVPDLKENGLANTNSSLIFGNMISNRGNVKIFGNVLDVCNEINKNLV